MEYMDNKFIMQFPELYDNMCINWTLDSHTIIIH